jgi:hypothetical protein
MMDPMSRARASGAPTIETAATPVASDFLVLDAEPDAFVFGCWKNVLLAIWKKQATGPSVERLDRAITAMAARQAGMRSNVHLVEHGAGLPTTEARAGFVDLMKRNATEIACVFIVIDGTGFWSGALRAALTGIRLLAPRSFHYSLVGSVEEVVRGLGVEHEKRTGVHLDAHELRSIIKTARCADKRGP